MRKAAFVLILFIPILTVLPAYDAVADTLEIASSEPRWKHVGALVLLYAHIGGGAIGLASGLVASFSKKGARIHRASGKVFFASMLVTYLIGAGVAPFLETGQRPNFVAGVLALYLLFTGVRAAQKKVILRDKSVWVGAIIAASIAVMGLTFLIMGANHESGTVDGSPPQAFIVFIVGGSFAVAGEINVLVKKKIIGGARITRHLWRMCASFFFASGSLFFGQPQVFPDWFNGSPLPFFCSFLPIFVLLYWVVRIKLLRRSWT
ncbi:MAG: hypothetical protein RH945_12490 [Hyphomonas sp.]